VSVLCFGEVRTVLEGKAGHCLPDSLTNNIERQFCGQAVILVFGMSVAE
jgi:hypothetical protein